MEIRKIYTAPQMEIIVFKNADGTDTAAPVNYPDSGRTPNSLTDHQGG